MSLRFLGRGLLVVPKSGLVTKRPPKRLAVRAPQLWGSLPENLRQAKMVSSLCLLSKLCFMQKLSYSSCIILTHCSLPFSLFYDGFVSTYCTTYYTTIIVSYNVLCVIFKNHVLICSVNHFVILFRKVLYKSSLLLLLLLLFV